MPQASLNGDAVKPKRKAKDTRPCDRCVHESARLFRVKTGGRDWCLVCRTCYDAVSAEPGYTYGGTWTGRKRN